MNPLFYWATEPTPNSQLPTANHSRFPTTNHSQRPTTNCSQFSTTNHAHPQLPSLDKAQTLNAQAGDLESGVGCWKWLAVGRFVFSV